MSFKYLAAFSLALAVALTLSWQWRDRAGFEEEVVRAALVQEVRREGTRCPLSDAAIAAAQPWLLAACAAGGPVWHEAARKYGDDAERVFLVYGQDPLFAKLFERLGDPVIPVVAYFVRNGSTQYLIQESLGQSISRLWNEGELSAGIAALTPEQYGLIAVHELNGRGHEMLSEFEIVDGVAVRRPITRAIYGAKNLLLGGVSDLEAVIVRGERLPSWSEVGWAAFDVALVAGGVGAAAKSLRAARAPVAVAARGPARVAAKLRIAGKGAVQSLAAVGTAAGTVAAIAIPYVVITRPDLVAGAAGWVAEQAGLPAWLGVFMAYAVLCLAGALLLRFILAPLTFLLLVLGRLLTLAAGLIVRSGSVASAIYPLRKV